MASSSFDGVVKAIKKQYGDQSISTAASMRRFDVIPSGSLCLDYITGIGGVPSNRVIEYAGEPGSGKSTLTLHSINNTLKMFPDRYGVFFDFEQKLETSWVANFIDDMDRLYVLNPDHIEQATDMYRDMMRSGEVCVVALDSIGGAPTNRTTSKSAEIANFGGNSIGIGEFARTAATYGGKYRCLTIGINQIRQDMSKYSRFMTPGGEAWKHACSLRFQLKRGPDKYVENKSNGEEVQVGYDVVVKNIKSGVGTPYRATKYRFYSEPSKSGAFGVDRLDEIMRLARLSEVITRRGAWYYHPELPDGKINGEAAMLDYAGEMPDFADAIEQEIRAKIASGEEIKGASASFDAEAADMDNIDELARKLDVEDKDSE